MGYLLLTNPSTCPKCRHSHKIPSYGQCRNCGMMLFRASDNFQEYEKDTGWREYWVFTSPDGWKHRTQVFDPTPLTPVVEPEKLPENYGTQEFLNEKVRSVREQARKEIKERTKKHIRVMKP